MSKLGVAMIVGTGSIIIVGVNSLRFFVDYLSLNRQDDRVEFIETVTSTLLNLL